MKKERLYIDSCCIIEGLKSKVGSPSQHDTQIDTIKKIFQAARDGAIELFTSYLSVSETLYIDKNNKPPNDEIKRLIERFLLSGKDGIKMVSVTPNIAIKARDLAWDYGIYTSTIDLIHVASAIQCEAKELLTLDSGIKNKFSIDSFDKCRVISPNETNLLPQNYRQTNLFQ